MILNTNRLPFPLSPGLKAIILQNIADSFMACVVNFHQRNSSPKDDGGNRPVEIAVDTDGSLIYIADFRFVDSPQRHEPIPETRFDFSQGEAHYHDAVEPLHREQERFQEWEYAFVTEFRLGNYKVEVAPLLELEEIVSTD